MALYNRARPMIFSDVLGQENAVKILKDGVARKKDEYPQVNIFIGPHGTGKTTCARILAKVLNCENPVDGEPCCECDSCRAIQAQTSPSVYELDAASNNGVDDARAIIEQSKFVSVGRKKVFILDEVQMLSTAAWNAFLKCFEEPPKDVYYILCTTEALKVTATAKSRCQEIVFKPIRAEVIREHLYDLCRKEDIAIAPDALDMIAKNADGHMRDAISSLEKYSVYDYIDTDLILEDVGEASANVVYGILDAVLRGDGTSALQALEGENHRGKSAKRLVQQMLEMLTEVIGYFNGVSGKESDMITDLAKMATPAKVSGIMDALIKAYPVFVVPQASFYLNAVLTNVVGTESLLCRMEADIEELKRGVVRAPALPKTPQPEENIVAFPEQGSADHQPAFCFDDSEESTRFANEFRNVCSGGGSEAIGQGLKTDDEREEVLREPVEATVPDCAEPQEAVSAEGDSRDLEAEPAHESNVEEGSSDENDAAAGDSEDAGQTMSKGGILSYEEMMGSLASDQDSGEIFNDECQKSQESGREESPAAKEVDFGLDSFDFFMSGGLARRQ